MERGACVSAERPARLLIAQTSIPVPAGSSPAPGMPACPRCKPRPSGVDKCKIQCLAPNCLLGVQPMLLEAQEASAAVPVSLTGGV